jgi:methylenetetrahydrofolate dehydrogenase (NADP+)/methenyltetrahydrofolate cyclohydrolase
MIIDWKNIGQKIYDDLKNEISQLKIKPTLLAVLVWNNSSSIRYIKQKQKWADYVWINFKLEKFDENITEKELLLKLKEYNNNPEVNWYIVQLPLPEKINSTKIINNIHPKKDVDWFHPNNQWKVLIWDKNGFIPCTPAGIIEIIKNEEIELEWKVVCVIWRSNIVWKPIVSLLINAWATVICCNSKTKNLDKFTTQSDIIIVAAWKPELLKVNMLKVWATVIDVWFTVINEKIYWDADTKLIDLVWNKVTPVPGWVWALTVAMLMKNTLKAYKIQNK